MATSFSVTRCGRTHGTRVPMRMISMCGTARTALTIASSLRSLSISGSPPEMTTSRSSEWFRMYSRPSSMYRGWIFDGSPTFLLRVQKRQYEAQLCETRKRQRSG